jgi:hypothetical protein
MSQHCLACGEALPDETTCEHHFHQMLFWEAENPALGIVHHLMVLCYHLQHPHLYSAEGLVEGKQLLVAFVQDGVTTEEIRRRNRVKVDSGKRSWKVTARPDSIGAYSQPVQWTMTAADVVAGGADHYCNNVRAWAKSVLDVLQTSGNRV